MPMMGYDMQEGTVVRWLKSEGSEVKNGEPIAEIETDKAVVEFESYAAGVLHKILVPEGSTVPVGQPIAIVGEPGESVNGAAAAPPAKEAVEEAPAKEAPAPRAAAPEPEAPAPAREPAKAPAGPVRASPVARRLAEERGIDLAQVQGTGPGGRITKDDVAAFADGGQAAPAKAAPEAPAEPERKAPPAPARPAAPAAAPAEVVAAGEKVPLSRMRQQIARVTVRSKQEKPHFYVTSEVDMTEAMALRQQVNKALESEGIRVTVNDLIIKACVEALKKYPKFNAFLQDDGLQMNEKVNIGVAMALEEGLLMPAIMDCGGKSLREIAQASKDLAERAQRGTLHPNEYTGGTFGISNLGSFDVTTFIAIIQPPQTAILAVGTVAKRPVVRNDELVIRQTMYATISADHRVVDGAEGAQFLAEVKRPLENPLSMVV
jgi:pyruvate dehydrogenase E2 component (dihydrolipoamide acetyltransferase)